MKTEQQEQQYGHGQPAFGGPAQVVEQVSWEDAEASRLPFRDRMVLLSVLAFFTLSVVVAPFTLKAWGIDVAHWFGSPQDDVSEFAPLVPGDRTLAELSAEDIARLSMHDISADFIREVAQLGYSDLSVDELIQLGIHDVDPDFVHAMRALGFDLSVEELVQLSIHDVDPEFVREMRAVGYGDLSVEDLVQLSIHGVEADFIRALQEAGLTDLSIEQVVQLGIHGVDPEFVREMRSLVK